MCGNAVVSVSDRLLTKAQKPWDPVANKNILVDLPSAQLIVGYAGAAYIQNRPTDEWLLETITGRPLPKPCAQAGRSQIRLGPRRSTPSRCSRASTGPLIGIFLGKPPTFGATDLK